MTGHEYPPTDTVRSPFAGESPGAGIEAPAFEPEYLETEYLETEYLESADDDDLSGGDNEEFESEYDPADAWVGEAGGKLDADLPGGWGTGIDTVLSHEAELTLGDMWDKARNALERTLVFAAVASGQRNENMITDAVFFRRHPDLKGVRLGRDDPRAAEWLAIRAELVRPLLKHASAGLTDPPAGSVSPGAPVDWARLRAAVVQIADRELAWWQKHRATENREPGRSRVRKYWTEYGGPPSRRGNAGGVWSAVFICWVMRQAGLGSSDFPPRAMHSRYLQDILRNARRGGTGRVTVYEPHEVPLRPGDLITNWRVGKRPDPTGPLTFSDLRDSAGPVYKDSHTDIVVEVEGARAWVVGGNKKDRVMKVDVDLDAEGVLKRVERDGRNRWVAVTRLGP